MPRICNKKPIKRNRPFQRTHSGSRRRLFFFANGFSATDSMRPFTLRAPARQTLTHRMQEMQRLLSVLEGSSAGIAPAGQFSAQAPHFTHFLSAWGLSGTPENSR